MRMCAKLHSSTVVLPRVVVAAIVWLIVSGSILVFDNVVIVAQASRGSNLIERVDIQQIDGSDLSTIEWWAKNICRDVSVKDAAKDLGVKPSRAEVVRILTAGLPKEARQRVAAICEERLLD